jgi:hypothetical protein
MIYVWVYVLMQVGKIFVQASLGRNLGEEDCGIEVYISKETELSKQKETGESPKTRIS